MKYTQCPPLLKENGELFKLEFARYETGGRDAAALQPRAPRRGDVYGISAGRVAGGVGQSRLHEIRSPAASQSTRALMLR